MATTEPTFRFAQASIGEMDCGQTAAEMFLECWGMRDRPEVAEFRGPDEVESGECRRLLREPFEVLSVILSLVQFGPLTYELREDDARLIGRRRPDHDGTPGRPVCLRFFLASESDRIAAALAAVKAEA